MIHPGKVRRAAIVAMVGVACFCGAASAVEPAHRLSAESGRGEAPAPRAVTLDSLPPAEPADLAAHPAAHRPADGLTDAQHRLRKLQAARLGPIGARAAAQPGAAPVAIPMTTAPTSQFAGMTQACTLPNAGASPALAVGPTYVLEAVDSCLAVYTKAGQRKAGYPKTLNAFLGLPAGADTYEPRAFYDWVNARYVLVIDYFDKTNHGLLYVAVSKTNDPTGAWWIYPLSLTSAGFTPDFPTAGQDRNDIYVGSNIFTAANGALGSFQFAEVLNIPKAQLYGGQPLSYTSEANFRDGSTEVDTIQPANVQDPTDNPRAEYLMATPNIDFNSCLSGCSGVIVWAVSNVANVSGTPGLDLSAVVVPTATTYALAPLADQKGLPASMDTGDMRITGGVTYAAGNLYATVTTKNAADTASVLAFEIHPTLGDNGAKCTGSFSGDCAVITGATMVSETCFYCNGQNGGIGYSFYGTQQPDPEGNVTLVYDYSDQNNYPGVVFTTRRISEAVNTFHDPGVFLAVGQAAYLGRYWGASSAVAVDVQQVGQPYMWFGGMFTTPASRWGTEIGRFAYTQADQP